MSNQYRKDFPFFQNDKDKDIIYFDNAATTQRPHQVMDAMRHFYEENNANPLRGLYELGINATDKYEEAREKVRKFINAKKTQEIMVVMLLSRMDVQARKNASSMALRKFLPARNSSFKRSNTSTLASTAMPMERIKPAMPESVKVKPMILNMAKTTAV